ncbi:MAG: hypothetical protein D6762_04675, partial [Candidatus Neomarinimicrobiota bacterium]
GVPVQILTGDVVFSKGPVVVVCQRAEYVEKTGQGSMTGRVTVTRRRQTLTCDSLHYDSPRDRLSAYGQVHTWDPEYDLECDTLHYFTELDSGAAAGSVRFKQKQQIIRGRRILYVKPEGARAARYRVLGHVTITEEGRVATCGEATYTPEPEALELIEHPSLADSSRVLTGTRIRIEYQEGTIRRLFIPEEAHVTARVSGYRESGDDSLRTRETVEQEDDMTGVRLRGFFQDGDLDSLRLEGMATVLYHVFDDSLYQGKNLSSGDTVVMTLAGDGLDQVHILGGAAGTYTPDPEGGDLEGPVQYHAEVIRYDVTGRNTDLIAGAGIRHQDTQLEAGYIRVDWTEHLLYAYPKHPREPGPELRPVLRESQREPMEGDTMVYNLDTRKGKVLHGKTRAEDGYFTGEEIRNQDERSLFVENSVYTTCSLDQPHFYFGSRRMKLIQKDKVIAKPLILYIGGIPVLGLPYALFPSQGGGRHSGWIMPSYGESANRGQFIDGLGYYWAPSPYWDTKWTLSFADRSGITLKAITPYRRRYHFSGNLYLETRQKLSGGERDIVQLPRQRKTDYVIKWSHRQQMRHDQGLNINASYYSNGEYNRATALDALNRMKQQAISNATYTKRWKRSNNSISLNLSSRRDLMAERRVDSTSVFYQAPGQAGQEMVQSTRTLPGFSFRHGQSPLLPGLGRILGNATWSYSMNGNRREQTYFHVAQDSAGVLGWDLDSQGNPVLRSRASSVIHHTFNVNAPRKIFRYITVNPQINLKSDWVDQSYTAELDSSTNTLRKRKITGWTTRTTGSFNLRTNTQIYGLFPVRIGPLNGIRHVLSPAISFRYTPDFSKPFLGRDLGYVETITDTAGQALTLDRFAGTLAGGTPQQKVKALAFSANNVFQAKLTRDGQTRKIDLLTYTLSTNYNYVAKEFRLSNLQSSVRTKLGRSLNLDLSMTHDFYQWDDSTHQRINHLRTHETGLPLPRLVNLNLGTSFRFSGKRMTFSAAAEDSLPQTDTSGLELEESYRYSSRLQEVARRMPGGQLWSSSVSLRYSLNNSNPDRRQKTFWMNTNSTVQLTRNWRIRYTARFDLVTRSLVSHSFSIYRDLHCWEMSVNWTPSGYGRGFYLKINVKSPNLKDLKLEQRGGVFRSRPNF